MVTGWALSTSERRVLEIVWRRGPIARGDIAQAILMGPASITRLTRDLEDRGLVFDTVQRDGARGQPSRPVALRPEGAFACGVNFSHSYVDVGLIDLTGRLISNERLPLERAVPEQIAAAARNGLARQAGALGITLDRIVGTGFSLPGDFGETPAFLNAHAFFPELQGRDLLADLTPLMPVPVFIENDAAAAAIGERVHGVGRQVETLLFIHIGHGVGSGMILDGRPYRGARANAGALGVLYPLSEPRPSGQDLLETLQAQQVPAGDFDALETLYPEECPPLRRWIARAGAQLRHGLHIAGRILDPELIILGGRLPPHLIQALLTATGPTRVFAESAAIPAPRITTSQLGSSAGVIGAASVCMFRTFFEDGVQP